MRRTDGTAMANTAAGLGVLDHAFARSLAVAVHPAAWVGVDPALDHGFGEAVRQQRLFAIAAHSGTILFALLEIFGDVLRTQSLDRNVPKARP